MELKISTKQVQVILSITAWVIFTGLCVQAGGLIVNACATLYLTAEGATHFWREIDLSGLYHYDRGHFAVMAFLIALVAVLKAVMFYLVIKLLHNKQLNVQHPFRKEVGTFIFHLSYLTLLIGLFSWRGAAYIDWLAGLSVKMPAVQSAGLGGADVWLFMSVVLFVIAHIFKRGIDIQKENELTV